MDNLRHLTGLMWSITDLLRGRIDWWEMGGVLVPFTVLRRLESAPGDGIITLKDLADEPTVSVDALSGYVDTFSAELRGTLERQGFLWRVERVERVEAAGVLRQVVARFAEMDLRRQTVSDAEMRHLLRDLLRRLDEGSQRMGGVHSTSSDVVRLMVRLLIAPDTPHLVAPGTSWTAMDPACGVGGMLDELEEQIAEISPDTELRLAGQDVNSEAWGICRLRMTAVGCDPSDIELGDTLTADQHAGRRFDYLLSAPPFAMKWPGSADAVRKEHEELGAAGRFGAGLPSTMDSSLLFLQHMLSKMKPEGSRVAVLFTGSVMPVGRGRQR